MRGDGVAGIDKQVTLQSEATSINNVVRSSYLAGRRVDPDDIVPTKLIRARWIGVSEVTLRLQETLSTILSD